MTAGSCACGSRHRRVHPRAPHDPGRPEAEVDGRDRRPVGPLQPSGPFSVRNDPPDHSVVCDDHCKSLRGVPGHIRSDNGPEFIARALREWIAAVGARTAFIEPGSPWENGYCESFNSKLRDALLNGELFYSLAEAKIVIESWRQHYNTLRPHSSLGYKPPAPAAISWPAAPPSPMATKPTMH
jgi:hypothetical protein